LKPFEHGVQFRGGQRVGHEDIIEQRPRSAGEMSLLTNVLAPLGLVPAGDAKRLHAESERTAEKLRTLEGRLAELKADAESWKRRHEETARKLADAQAAAARAEARAQREEARAEELKGRGNALVAEMKEMRARLQDASRTGATVREHLMATETKLDLIEAALQVLDARTRLVTVLEQAPHAAASHGMSAAGGPVPAAGDVARGSGGGSGGGDSADKLRL
jgi:hypothetical protein